MSDSRIKTPIAGIAGSTSEKSYKKIRAKRERQMLREKIKHLDLESIEEELCPWDEWSTNRDGKEYMPEFFDTKKKRSK